LQIIFLSHCYVRRTGLNRAQDIKILFVIYSYDFDFFRQGLPLYEFVTAVITLRPAFNSLIRSAN